MVVRIHPWRITWRYLAVFAVLLIVGLISFSGLFLTMSNGSLVLRPWGATHTAFVTVFATAFVALYPFALFGQSYVIEDKYFAVRKFKKEFVYEYKNIEFIDFDESKRKKMVILYTKKSRMKYLLGDKDGLLLETLIKKCPDVMNVYEFRRRHPEERY